MRRKLVYILLFIGGAFFACLLVVALFYLAGPEANGPGWRFPLSLLLYPLFFLVYPSLYMGVISAFVSHGFRVVGGDIPGYHAFGYLLFLYGFYACLLGYLVSTKKGWIRTILTLLAIHLLILGVFYGIATLLGLHP